MGIIIRASVVLVLTLVSMNADSIYRWIKSDNYSAVQRHMLKIIYSDCKSNSKQEMVLPDHTVTQLPRYNQMINKFWYRNRSALIQVHNMALNRAMFYSYILQKMNDSESFDIQPDWNYFSMATTADVNGNMWIINGSALYFDAHCHYPNWYNSVNFNQTLKFFGPKAYRVDDTYDMGIFLREPTWRTNVVKDFGSGDNRNYTHEIYKMNPWYNFWLPDLDGDQDSVLKFTYSVNIKYSNETGKFIKNDYDTFNFFGPNSPGINEEDDRKMPVRFTKGYFDCGGSKKWVVTAAAPVVDFMPRYLNWTHMRRQRFVGVVVIDTDFMEVDFNPCDTSIGNPGPSFLSGIEKCRKETTQCKFKAGRGFGRGGYTCPCRSGYRYPVNVEGPFQGRAIEQATEPEYFNSYQCIKSDLLQVLPIVEDAGQVRIKIENNQSSVIRTRSLHSLNESTIKSEKMKILEFENILRRANLFHDTTDISNHKNIKHTRMKRSTDFDSEAFNRMTGIFHKLWMVRKENCRSMPYPYKTLPGDVAYGVEDQFDNQARAALRISHFLTNFYQNVIPVENFGNMKGGNRLHYEHLFGEVLANVMSDHKILSSGIFYEPYFFENTDGSKREYFGPWAFKRGGEYFAIDTSGFKNRYTDEEWYKVIASRWQTNTKGIKKYRMKSLIRSDPNGTNTIKHEYYPMGYFAPSVTDGVWSRPYFKCDGRVDAWVVTYSVPFIGLDDLRKKKKFRGVVTVDVPLEELEINQCAQPFPIPNAFKNTARCDYRSTNCKPLEGFKFQRGAYRCDCKMGYEYPWKDGREWYDGSMVEQEYLKKYLGLFSIYDGLKCRVSAASTLQQPTVLLTLCSIIITVVTKSNFTI